uniref:Si:dkey-73n10.1 n=2 Tax=Cyprinus carpio carpio TaxID=630221 RepID=A0A9J8DN70_CYPCA
MLKDVGGCFITFIPLGRLIWGLAVFTTDKPLKSTFTATVKPSVALLSDLAGSSQSRESKMSSKQGRSCIDPVVQSNMEGAMGTVVPTGLPKADSLPHYSHDKALPISRAYFPYAFGGQDTLDFPSPWGPSKTCMRNGPGPGIHSSAAEGSVPVRTIYRPDKVSFPVDAGGGRCAVPQELAAKQRLAYYASSPRQHSPRAAGVISPVPVPKGHNGGSDAESCVGLAIPKPVYGHSPCCTERGCTAGHYGVEHGPQRMSPRIYDEEWAAHFSRLAYLHKKGQEAFAQQRVLQLEHGTEGIKDGKTESYHGIRSNEPRRSLSLMQPSYTYNTAHQFIGSTPEYCQRAPIPPQIYKGLPHTYDSRALAHHGVPSKVYQELPRITKYTPMPPCPTVYYPQNHHEAYQADHNVITDEHGQHHHMGQFHSPRADLMSPSCSVVPPHHPIIPKYPTYQSYRVHFNSNQAPMHDRPHPPFSVHQSERPLDFSIRRVQTPDSPWELSKQSGTTGAFHPFPAHYRRLSNTTTLEHSGMSDTGFLVSSSKEFPTKSREDVIKIRHCVSDPPDKDVLAKRPREELEMDMASKRQKIDSTHELSDNEPQSPSSPLMPVINKVFSLAPYKVYFEATGMLSSLGNSNPQPEATLLKQEPEIQNCDLEPNSGESDLSLKQDTQMSPANSDSPVEMPETVKIKKEKLDPDEVACQSEIKESTAEEINHQAESYEVKEEQEEPGEPDTSTSDSLPCHVVVKSDFEEERNPFLVEKSESLATCKSEIAVKDNMDYIPVPTLPSTPTVPPQLTKFSLTKIPPHCLKLANFKIVIPEVLKAPVTQPIEVPQSPLEAKPIISSSKHARHQFMELHQSLCRLIYCCVNQTPCQELRDWLCRLDLQESGKDQKVSCLLGSKMREVWLKGDEMEVALKKVVFQLQKYVESRECPFPHVIRAGAVFIPMLVVKEVLFPQVQGAFIDQVLQEHRVELRPTTLTEERQLTHLHRKAFSSKLRRLLSLKHLPDIYPDVLNLLYHANVCKFLDSTATDGVQKMPRSRNQLNVQEREHGQLR